VPVGPIMGGTMAKLSFLGAARTVTGSQYLVESNGARVMIDCGLFQGQKELRLANWAEPTFDAASVKALVLTHTHLDHIGRIPRLVKQGFRGKVYCTPPTLELAEILLKDSAHLQKEDAEYLNRKGYTKHEPALPLYDEADVEEALQLFEALPYGSEREVGPAMRFTYVQAGHILGAGSVELRLREGGGEMSLLFSGDVGRFDTVLVKDPQPAQNADYVVVESTYGNRLHEKTSVLDELEAITKRTFARGGVLVVPAFAVSRAQQMIYLFEELVSQGRLRHFPIHLDSPMAVDATRIYSQFPDYHRVNLAGVGGRSLLYEKWISYHKTREESEALNKIKGPAVIISSSGMLAGGRILHHCRVRLPHPENTLLITGYQAATTLGRALLDGSKLVRIHKQEVSVQAEVAELHGMSGHADADELMRWLSGVSQSPRCVFVTHGEEESALALSERIRKERGFGTHVPRMNETVDLTRGMTGSPVS
jgi:metallo-beta-lactamase family protein